MKSVFGLISTALVASAYNNEIFQEFVKKFEKTYSEDELIYREGVFASNYAHAMQENEYLREAGADAVYGVTKFMDLTPAEFKQTILMPSRKSEASNFGQMHMKNRGVKGTSIDWRTKNVVTPVKDQGMCGSCWAFSITEAIESFAALSGKPLVPLSVQQITSCDHTDSGCGGGQTNTAYKYVMQAGGLDTEDDYPYTSGDEGVTGICKVRTKDFVISISGFKSIAQGEDNLAAAVEALGPVSVCLAASAFQNYIGGVLTKCPGQIDHCVQAVGFTDDYWIVRNSWNVDWGEQGYILIQRGSNLCKISNDATYPIISNKTNPFDLSQ